MGELIKLIDDWRQRHGGVAESAVSRTISGSRGTVGAWRHRGINEMPKKETLIKLARMLNVPEETVVMAAAIDAGIVKPKAGDGDDHGNAGSSAPMNDERRSDAG